MVTDATVSLPGGPPVTATPTRRERARAATVEEIKSTALALMREEGTTDVRFTDIARVMGMTPPALYRYGEVPHPDLRLLRQVGGAHERRRLQDDA